MHRNVTLIGHNAVHDPLRRLPTCSDPSRAPDEPPRRRARRRRSTPERRTERPAPAQRHASSRARGRGPRSARAARRRRRPSGSAGRIVVSLPAHLDVECRQKTIDWLVEPTAHASPPAVRLGDDELLARAIALSDRYLRRRPPGVRSLGHQPDGPLGLVLVLLGRDPRVASAARRARLGARLGAGARGGAPDPPGPLPRLPSAGRCVPAPRGSRACSWPATASASRHPLAERPRPAGADASSVTGRSAYRGRKVGVQTGSSASIRPSRRRLSFAPPSVSSIWRVRRK